MTKTACSISFVTSAIVNNYAPLLFSMFQNSYGITLENISVFIALNFGAQILAALIFPKFIDRIGYRISTAAALLLAASGLAGLAFLPDLLPSPFIGLLAAVVIYALGSGIINVTINPIIEECSLGSSEKTRSLLYSSYCWGYVAVVALSTVFFNFFGLGHWKLLTCLWAVVPLFDAALFLLSPAKTKKPDAIGSDASQKSGISLKQLISSNIFIGLVAVMICSGASEHTMSQWASMFAEIGLGVSKAVGDFAGPCFFAAMMGISRIIYTLSSKKIKLETYMLASGILCALGYVLAALPTVPAVSFLGFGLCGFSAGIFWPGTVSLAARSFPGGGTPMFAALALTGNIGAAAGPMAVGIASEAFGSLGAGLLLAAIFPAILAAGIIYHMKNKKTVKN